MREVVGSREERNGKDVIPKRNICEKANLHLAHQGTSIKSSRAKLTCPSVLNESVLAIWVYSWTPLCAADLCSWN